MRLTTYEVVDATNGPRPIKGVWIGPTYTDFVGSIFGRQDLIVDFTSQIECYLT